MEKVYLTANEIDNTCLRIKEKVTELVPQYEAYVHFLYWYGVRINEVFDFRISYDVNMQKIVVYPQKNNNPRYLNIATDKCLGYLEILQTTQDLYHLNKKNLQRLIEKANPYRILKCGNKKIGAHLFRHNYIKKLVADGKQIMTIDTLMGYTNQTVADTYAVSNIYYEF